MKMTNEKFVFEYSFHQIIVSVIQVY